MSIPALYELNGELTRLAVAGAALAKGDFRVKRLIPVFQKSGESVPVFARAAELLEQLTGDGEPDRPARLLDLMNLVNAVLATQGKTGADGGDFVPMEGIESGFSSLLPYRRLKPIEDALTRGSSGRMEVLRQAQEEGAFSDFRLAAPLVQALSDSYTEINGFAVERLAAYGKAIVPYLKKGFDPAGGKAHARRVEAVSRAAGPDEDGWYRQLAEEAEGPVKAEAVFALRHRAENEDALLTHTLDRKKEVREAAYGALGYFDSEAVSRRFCEAFDGRDRSAAMQGIVRCPMISLTEHLMGRAEAALTSLVGSGRTLEAERKKTAIGYADGEAATLSDALEALRCKTHPDLLPLYTSFEKYAPHMTWLAAGQHTSFGTVARQWAHNILMLGAVLPDGTVDAKAGPPERFALLDGLLGRFNYFVEYSFAASAMSKSPETVYERYAPLLKAGKKETAARTILETFLCVVEFGIGMPACERYTTLRSVELLRAAKPLWDDRWLDLFIAADEGLLVARCARKGHRKCGDYLAGKVQGAMQNPRESLDLWSYVAGLIQMGHDKAGQLALQALKARLAAKDYMPKYDGDALRLLPGDCAPQLAELAVQHNDRTLEDIAEQVRKNPELEKKKRFGIF